MSRIHLLPNKCENPKLVRFCDGARMLAYDPTPTETDLALLVYDVVKKDHPLHYVRVDMIGKGTDPNGRELLVSEIECINPDPTVKPGEGVHTQERREIHYHNIESMFLDAIKNK